MNVTNDIFLKCTSDVTLALSPSSQSLLPGPSQQPLCGNQSTSPPPPDLFSVWSEVGSSSQMVLLIYWKYSGEATQFWRTWGLMSSLLPHGLKPLLCCLCARWAFFQHKLYQKLSLGVLQGQFFFRYLPGLNSLTVPFQLIQLCLPLATVPVTPKPSFLPSLPPLPYFLTC